MYSLALLCWAKYCYCCSEHRKCHCWSIDYHYLLNYIIIGCLTPHNISACPLTAITLLCSAGVMTQHCSEEHKHHLARLFLLLAGCFSLFYTPQMKLTHPHDKILLSSSTNIFLLLLPSPPSILFHIHVGPITFKVTYGAYLQSNYNSNKIYINPTPQKRANAI